MRDLKYARRFYRSLFGRQRGNIIITESHRDPYRFIKRLTIILRSHGKRKRDVNGTVSRK